MSSLEEAVSRLNSKGWNISLDDNGRSAVKMKGGSKTTRVSSPRNSIPLIRLINLKYRVASFLANKGIRTAKDLKEYVKEVETKVRPGLRSLCYLQGFGEESLANLRYAIKTYNKLSLDDFE